MPSHLKFSLEFLLKFPCIQVYDSISFQMWIQWFGCFYSFRKCLIASKGKKIIVNMVFLVGITWTINVVSFEKRLKFICFRNIWINWMKFRINCVFLMRLFPSKLQWNCFDRRKYDDCLWLVAINLAVRRFNECFSQNIYL